MMQDRKVLDDYLFCEICGHPRDSETYHRCISIRYANGAKQIDASLTKGRRRT